MPLRNTQAHEQKTLTSNTTTTLQIPTGGKIQSIQVAFLTSAGVPVTEAQARAEIGNVRLTIQGTDVINCTAAQLYDAYETLGTRVGTSGGVPGTIELNLGALVFTDPLLRDLYGFGTKDVSSIQLQVTSGTLSAAASVRAYTQRIPVSENLGSYIKLINYPQSFNATGLHTVDTLPRDQNSSYLMALIDDGESGTIASSECRLGSVNVTEPTLTGVNAGFCSSKAYVQPAGYFAHVFADGSGTGKLPMLGVTDLRFVTSFSVAPGAAGYNILALTTVDPVTPTTA